jgi:hypothetical protein
VGNLKGKGSVSIELRNLISAAICFHGATANHERTLAHENLRKQEKVPNIAEYSLGQKMQVSCVPRWFLGKVWMHIRLSAFALRENYLVL